MLWGEDALWWTQNTVLSYEENWKLKRDLSQYNTNELFSEMKSTKQNQKLLLSTNCQVNYLTCQKIGWWSGRSCAIHAMGGRWEERKGRDECKNLVTLPIPVVHMYLLWQVWQYPDFFSMSSCFKLKMPQPLRQNTLRLRLSLMHPLFAAPWGPIYYFAIETQLNHERQLLEVSYFFHPVSSGCR